MRAPLGLGTSRLASRSGTALRRAAVTIGELDHQRKAALALEDVGHALARGRRLDRVLHVGHRDAVPVRLLAIDGDAQLRLPGQMIVIEIVHAADGSRAPA